MSGLLLTFLVGVAGGIGSALRCLADNSLPERLRARFPWGTMAINLSGSLLLGLVTGLMLSHPWSEIIATGLLGGYTTFSAASLESIRLLSEKRYTAALTHSLGMLTASTALSVAGILITAQ